MQFLWACAFILSSGVVAASKFSCDKKHNQTNNLPDFGKWYRVGGEYVCPPALSSVVLNVPTQILINVFHIKAHTLFRLMHLIQCKH